MKKKTIILTAVAVLLVLLTGLTAWLLIRQHNAKFVKIDGQMIPKDQVSLDYSGQTVPDTKLLQQFTNLQELNVTNTGLTAEGYEALKAALPGCKIAWSVPFQGSFYPEDTAQLTVSGITQADIDVLKYFPQLQTVDALACRDYAGLDALSAAYPNVDVLWQLEVGSQLLTKDTTDLVLGDGTAEQLSFALSRIPTLCKVDAAGCHDYTALEALQQQYPDCDITYTVTAGNQQVSPDVTSLSLENPDLDQLASVLPHLPQMQKVTLSGSIPSNDAVHALQTAFPGIVFEWSFPLCGVEVSSTATEIDLSNIPMETTREVEDSLKYFHNLQRVIMCDCGIADEEMDALGKRNPQVRFVWTVSIGHYIRLRTDATYFMPYLFGATITDADTAALKYCVDLICIDVGHMEISDVSFLAYMPHMKYLLLCDTNVSDISAVEGMEELIFCELFLTQVQDYSPLISCKNLKDLNICYSVPHNVSALCQMTQLENLWMKGAWDEKMKSDLIAALPNTTIVFSNGNISSTGDGWRLLQNYRDMRDLLGMYYQYN